MIYYWNRMRSSSKDYRIVYPAARMSVAPMPELPDSGDTVITSLPQPYEDLQVLTALVKRGVRLAIDIDDD